jgi:hypothetical protein
MELKDFVRDTLLDIIQGVKAAQDECGGTGVIICPRSGQVDSKYIRGPQTISFNIVLGGEEGEKGTSGIKVSFPQIGFQIGKISDENKKNSEQTSVSFAVPIYFSHQKE